MTANETTPLIEQGNSLLVRLFEIARSRLLERGIGFRYEPEVIGWFLDQPGWSDRINPLRTLDGFWHRHVGNPIADLLVQRSLLEKGAVSVHIDHRSSDPRLALEVTSPNSTGSPILA